MAVYQRPLNLGEILDRTVQLYRRNFLPFAGISALPAGISVLVFGGAGVFLGSRLATFKPGVQDYAVIGVAVGLLLLIGLPAILAAYTLDLSASTYAALRAHDGQKFTIRDSYGFAFRHFWRHLGLLCLQVLFAGIIPYCVFLGIFVVGTILATLVAKGAGNAFTGLFAVLTVLAVIALIVVCILLWLRFSLGFSVSVSEEKTAWLSIKRSSELSKGTRGRIFVMFLLVSILSSVVSYALLIPMLIVAAMIMQKSLVGNQPPTEFLIVTQASVMAVSFLVRAFVTPVYSTALMLFYFDQRTRQEGYDIEQLMAQAGWTTLPPVLPPVVPVSLLDVASPPPIEGSFANTGAKSAGESAPPESAPVMAEAVMRDSEANAALSEPTAYSSPDPNPEETGA
jgi:hypothetical protein